jgi:hypothetical protein
MGMDRRHFLKLGSKTAFTAGAFAGYVGKDIIVRTAADKLEEELASKFKLISNWIGTTENREPFARERRDLVYHLFLRSEIGDTEFLPADKWSGGQPDKKIASGRLTYGHEATVCNAMADFLHIDLNLPYAKAEAADVAHGPDSKIILGSGAVNDEAAKYLGTPDDPKSRYGSLRLHYGIGNGTGMLKRWQYGKEIERKAHIIRDARGRRICEPDSQNQYQKDDFLLVTRLPGEEPGTCNTLFTGLQGPGTRAAELLFSERVPLDDLRKLAGMIDSRPGETPFYQAVFRASKFDSNLARDTTNSDVATEINLVIDKCPPLKLDTIL